MPKQELLSALLFAVPQIFTALRVIIGVWALFGTVFHNVELAARLVIIGAITDFFDGWFARKLGVASEFGTRFDYFADYAFHIIVPVLISVFLIEPVPGPFSLAILGLPFLAGAIRYAQITGKRRTESFDQLGTPGLGTNIYSFYIIAMVFLRKEGAIHAALLEWILVVTVPVFSIMMVAPVRYPKYAKYWFILCPVVAGLNLMPFVLTKELAFLSIFLICLHVLCSPLVVNQRRERAGPHWFGKGGTI